MQYLFDNVDEDDDLFDVDDSEAYNDLEDLGDRVKGGLRDAGNAVEDKVEDVQDWMDDDEDEF